MLIIRVIWEYNKSDTATAYQRILKANPPVSSLKFCFLYFSLLCFNLFQNTSQNNAHISSITYLSVEVIVAAAVFPAVLAASAILAAVVLAVYTY